MVASAVRVLKFGYGRSATGQGVIIAQDYARMNTSRFTGSTLNAWRVSHGLQVDEMAWVFGYSVSTLKDKLYSRSPIRLDTDRIAELVDLALHRGCTPPGWPTRLRHRIHQNVVPDNTSRTSYGANSNCERYNGCNERSRM